MILVGLRGVLVDATLTKPVNLGIWLLGLAVLHDVLLAPATYAVAALVGRVLPQRSVTPVRVGLAGTALALVVTWPLVRGYGRRASNPTALPLDYGRNLIAGLVVGWVAITLWIIARSLLDHRARRDRPPAGQAPAL
jgi:hypothetical protein